MGYLLPLSFPVLFLQTCVAGRARTLLSSTCGTQQDGLSHCSSKLSCWRGVLRSCEDYMPLVTVKNSRRTKMNIYWVYSYSITTPSDGYASAHESSHQPCYVLWTHAQVLQSCSLLWSARLRSARLPCPWDYPSENTGVGCHFLLQGIFPTQGSNPSLLRLLHWQVNSLPLSHLGNPILYIIFILLRKTEGWERFVCFQTSLCFFHYFLWPLKLLLSEKVGLEMRKNKTLRSLRRGMGGADF